MPIADQLAFKLAIALGIGLLIGVERERRKGQGPFRAPAGIRTFAITSLLGAIGLLLGGELLLATLVLGLALLLAVAYKRNVQQDPGLTTETALMLTLLLGGLCTREPALASGLAVAVVILLAARTLLHHFVLSVLSEAELTDALILAASALVVLPLLPDAYIGPFGALNLRTIWKFAVLMMAISAAGHVALRSVGPRFGLPIAGLASGFISSTMTISSMGTRADREPALMHPAVTGAVLSTVATILQMAIVLAVTNRATLYALAIPLVCSVVAAIAYAAFFIVKMVRHEASLTIDIGRPFNLKTALLFSSMISAILFVSAGLNAWLGTNGLIAASSIGGFADAHAAAASIASFVASGRIGTPEAVIPILAGLTTNTISKAMFAYSSGGRVFAAQVVPGLAFVIGAAWLGFAITMALHP